MLSHCSPSGDNYKLYYKDLEVLDSLDIGTESLAFLDSFICTLFVKVESFFVACICGQNHLFFCIQFDEKLHSKHMDRFVLYLF